MENQSDKQKMIALATSEHAPAVVLLLKHLIKPVPLLGNNEYETIVNAVKFDTQSDILRGVVDLMEAIRQGSLHEPQQ